MDQSSWSRAQKRRRRCRGRDTHLVQNGCDDIVIQHALVGGLGKNAIEVVGLVGQGVGAHGKFNDIALDALGGDDDSAVLADLALVASPAPHDDIDVCVLAQAFDLEFAFLALGAGSRDG